MKIHSSIVNETNGQTDLLAIEEATRATAAFRVLFKYKSEEMKRQIFFWLLLLENSFHTLRVCQFLTFRIENE